MLVIVGETGLGKSLLGAAVLENVALKLGLEGYLEVTVENSGALDLSDLDVRRHSGVLLDGVGDALLSSFAQRISHLLFGDDVLARVGGDEFVLLLHHGGEGEILKLVQPRVAYRFKPGVHPLCRLDMAAQRAGIQPRVVGFGLAQVVAQPRGLFVAKRA